MDGADGPYPDLLAEYPEELEAALIHAYPAIGDPVAGFWRGEVSGRLLAVLINGLPQDSALHRASTDGHTWMWREELAWQTIHALRVIDERLSWQKTRKFRKPKFSRFPWSRNERRFGNRGGGSTKEVLEALRALRPGGGATDTGPVHVEVGGGRHGVASPSPRPSGRKEP